MDVKDKKIFVGLSGGVDSAVSAALLKKQGANVTGVFIKGWYPPELPCSWAEDRRDAMRVAAHLGIPFHTLDASHEYKKSVIDYLLTEYKQGRTPNPDIFCNRDIKFGVFYEFAKSHGANGIATGHYRGGEKDQSYFLWAVPRDILAETIFPVSDMTKDEVRALARQFDLPVFDKKDSQGICFLGSVSVKDFLRNELGDNPALLYTLGERVDGEYVVAKDIESGTIQTAPALTHNGRASIAFQNANWQFERPERVQAQLRYHGELISGTVLDSSFLPGENVKEIPVPGQSIVFYDGGRLVGGGIIAA